MGAWGNGIWQDDVADDVLIIFEDLLEAGATPLEAIRGIILTPPWSWDDVDGHDAQVLALAALAVEHGVLTPTLRSWAIATLDSGAPLGRWE